MMNTSTISNHFFFSHSKKAIFVFIDIVAYWYGIYDALGTLVIETFVENFVTTTDRAAIVLQTGITSDRDNIFVGWIHLL